MARKLGKRDSRYLAKIVTGDRTPCVFCNREVDEEITYGKLYAIGEIQCHYFCVLLSCCLVQKGPEEEGLFGFMYKDILAELERSKKHKCSYCRRGGANLGCAVGSCRKQFHLPCGRERNAVSLYHGSFKSFCETHAPEQSIPEHIMSKVSLRIKGRKKTSSSTALAETDKGDQSEEEDMVCVICYEAVDAYPTVNTFWPPCCARDAWFHRSCLQRMSLSAGMHYLKCPLCNDKENFYDAVLSQGYYVPDRDAAWELEQNAFAEIYERTLTCSAEQCQCPTGRDHDSDQGMWEIKLCLLCGSVGAHAHCIEASEKALYVCLTCTPAVPDDIQALADAIEKMIVQEQANSANTIRHGPIMPSRMSLRRTKGRIAMSTVPANSRAHVVNTEYESPVIVQEQANSANAIGHGPVMPSRMSLRRTKGRIASSTESENSTAHVVKTEYESPVHSLNVQSSRQELNLKTPYRPIHTDSYKPDSPRKTTIQTYKTEKLSPIKLLNNQSLNDSYNQTELYKNLEAMMLSPMKLLEQSFKQKVVCMGVGNAKLDENIVDMLRNRFRKPRPLSVKKKILDDILNGLFDNLNNLKQKDPVREWSSPRKCYDINEENDNQTASENGTKNVKNTVENKENLTYETPKKTSTLNKIETSRLYDNYERDDNSTHKETNEKISGENNHKDIDDYNKNMNEVVDKHNYIEGKDNEDTYKDTKEKYGTHDESSNSTFELSPEFLGETLSDDSFMTFEPPKRKPINLTPNKIETSRFDNIFERDDNSTRKEPNEIYNGENNHKHIEDNDKGIERTHNESSSSTFELPSEFVAETLSDDGIMAFETPKRKTIDIKQESRLEISELDHSVSIVIENDESDKTPQKKSSFKFSPLGKEKLVINNVGTDLESFKKKYLSEVLKEFKCCFNHKHQHYINKSTSDKTSFRTVIDFAIDAHFQKQTTDLKNVKKRKLSEGNLVLSFDKNEVKKRKMSENDLDLSFSNSSDEFETKSEIKSPAKELIEKPVEENKAMDLTDKTKRNIKRDKDKKRVHEVSERRVKKRNLKDKIRSDKSRRLKDEDKSLRDRKLESEQKCMKDKYRERRVKDIILDTGENRLESKIKDEKKYKRIVKYDKNSDKHAKNKKQDRKKRVKDKKGDHDIEVTIDSSERKLKKKTKKNKQKTKLSIRNNEKDISVKIKWKKKQVRLKIESKDKTEKDEKFSKFKPDSSKFKQYVLQYYSEVTPTEVLVKPDKEVGPLKRKYVKHEKTVDNYKQMSIQNFFKVQPSNE